ncbi:MAG: asparagine synthase (glutamine-hydrolyzing) [Candidatus Latescibacterota bacterium]|nr:MAG: asparagine synthase (glutamine-hydrolyzing) [Candidatus Latescibacterota bacterium]
MCGIAGVYRFREGADDRSIVGEMIARLERRGPDDQGVEQDGPLTVGNRRLAILDLSTAGHQPMRSADGRYLVSFNGEIYNHDDIRRELGIESSDLRSTTDTEIVLHAWARWGPDALHHMVGQWAMALFDSRESRLWLARDRFGEKPLYYYHDSNTLSFASSLPALVEAPWVPRELDSETLVEYATLRYVVSPRTVISGVRKLPGGHILSVSKDGINEQRWYTPHFNTLAKMEKRSPSSLVEEFDALFARASTRCLVSDVPVALLLSDGIDSNSIRAVLSGHGRQVRSFTYTLTDSSSGLSANDADPAGGTDGSVAMDLRVTATDRVRQMVPAFESFTEPVGDGAALATWLLIRNAREHATVFLCGHGGDEILGGYRLSQDRFRLALVRSIVGLPLPLVRRLVDRFVHGNESVEHRRRALLSVPPKRTPEATRYLIHRPLPVEDLETLLHRPLAPADGYVATIDRLYAECLDSATDLDRMQKVMVHTFLSENILSFADSVAMDSSAELRMPFLDRDLVEFVMSLPSHARVSRWPGRANTKLILRWWSDGRLPAAIVSQRKRAFPFGNLPELLSQHGGLLRDRILGSVAVRRVFPGVEKWLEQDPIYYRGPWEGTLWALLSLGIWCDRHGIS